MKKFSEKAKAFVKVMAIVAVLLLPGKSIGQTNTDGFFSSYSGDYAERTNSYDDVANQTFGQNYGLGMGLGSPQHESPVGSGLLIMTIAGASYVLLKKKNN
ncbi:MAG: hypothetical protein J6T37_03085 [Bacteroidales bacterium]|jgi:hypothetical protein|nr:hypothetical protein [Bacteroidales bacterium]MBO7528839.1 hypothetical protein [Bacteroidales bacterium]